MFIRKKNKKSELFKFVQLKRIYSSRLKKTVSYLKFLKEETHQRLHLLLTNNLSKKQRSSFLILYTILFYFSPSNSFLQISKSNGVSKIFCTAGSFHLTGKQKILKKLILIKYFKFLSKLNFLKNKPVALHLKNIKFKKHFILKKLKSNFFIKTIKTFNSKPYNGCRRKKEKR